jgi:hypothetical protein
MKPATVCMEANYSRDGDNSSRRNNRNIMNANQEQDQQKPVKPKI